MSMKLHRSNLKFPHLGENFAPVKNGINYFKGKASKWIAFLKQLSGTNITGSLEKFLGPNWEQNLVTNHPVIIPSTSIGRREKAYNSKSLTRAQCKGGITTQGMQEKITEKKGEYYMTRHIRTELSAKVIVYPPMIWGLGNQQKASKPTNHSEPSHTIYKRRSTEQYCATKGTRTNQ